MKRGCDSARNNLRYSAYRAQSQVKERPSYAASLSSSNQSPPEPQIQNSNSLKATLTTGESLTQLLKILENPNSAENLVKIESYTQEVSLLRAQIELLQESAERDRQQQREFQNEVITRISSLEQ